MKWPLRKWEEFDYFVIILVLIWIISSILIVLAVFSPRSVAVTTPNFRTATRQAPATLHLDYATTRDSSPIATIYMEISAYSPSVQECDATPLITASGKRVYVGGIAADLDVLPFGSIVIIPNYNNGKPCIVTDTGSAIRGNKLDVFMWRESEAIRWGRRKNVSVEVLYIPRAK